MDLGLVFAVIFGAAVAHETPCNVNNDTLCLQGVREEFVRTDYWFGSDYYKRCPDGPADKNDYSCMNPDINHTSIASRMLGQNDFNTSTIQQFLRIRFNSPRGVYQACGHMTEVGAYTMVEDLDNTHTINLDAYTMSFKPTITFDNPSGDLYTLVVYDAGYLTLGGVWVNIRNGDASSGQEMYPYMGPVNALYTLRNPYVLALFKQSSGETVNIEAQKKQIISQIEQNDGRYFLGNLIANNSLQGPVAIGYIVINTDPYSIKHFYDRNIYNNCPYLVTRQPEVTKALKVMGYNLTTTNSFTDYRGTFLTSLELDVTVTYVSGEAHFESCCGHTMMMMEEVRIDPQDFNPVMPLYTRDKPYVTFSPVAMANKSFGKGKLFTLFMVDVTDAVKSTASPNVVVHWQVANIPGSDVDRGDTVLEYMSPMPMSQFEVRTFLFLVVAQTVKVDPQAIWSYTGSGCDEDTVMRCNFDFGSFLQHTNFKLVGVSVFRSQQDSFTRAVLYGSIDPNNIPSSMSDFMSMPPPYIPQPKMAKAEACQGVSGYSEPCPTGCSPSTDHNHDQPMPTTMKTTTMNMVHNHGK